MVRYAIIPKEILAHFCVGKCIFEKMPLHNGESRDEAILTTTKINRSPINPKKTLNPRDVSQFINNLPP